MTTLEKNIRFTIGTTIGNSTSLFWIKHNREKQKDKLIYPDCDICIEGFQRSGNSFFYALFKRRNRGLKIAHHTHAAAQVIKAIEYQVPTIVLIRKPEDAISSLIVWDEKLSITTAFKSWISFYQSLLKYRNKILVTSFEEVTENPVKVVLQTNERFETDFSLPRFKADKLVQIKATMLKRNYPLSSPLPTIEKEEAKRKHIDSIKGNHLYTEANQLYTDFLENR